MTHKNIGKKVVISGSSSFIDKIEDWRSAFIKNEFQIIDWPEQINKETFLQDYPLIHRNFYLNITKAEYLFIMNEDKNGIEGYIGAETFAELAFGVAQKIIYQQELEIVVYKMPSVKVQSSDEIKLWLELGWISLLEDSPLKVVNQL